MRSLRERYRRAVSLIPPLSRYLKGDRLSHQPSRLCGASAPEFHRSRTPPPGIVVTPNLPKDKPARYHHDVPCFGPRFRYLPLAHYWTPCMCRFTTCFNIRCRIREPTQFALQPPFSFILSNVRPHMILLRIFSHTSVAMKDVRSVLNCPAELVKYWYFLVITVPSG